MKIAIHHRPGSFSERWIDYCKENKIDYKLVNAYDSDIVKQVDDCDAFMWHHHHADYKDALFAKQLLYSLQLAGKKVFPDFATGWHFDDKVGQKYLFEAIGAPLVPSYVFYTKKEALRWADKTTFPKVFKLRGGAGASNVKLARTRQDTVRLIDKAFGKGFSQFDRWGYLKERFHKWRAGKGSFVGVFKGVARLGIPTEFAKFHAPEKGYVYFQEFIPNDGFDIRVLVVGKYAVALQRNVRKGDFRASGSGNLVFPNGNMDKQYIRLAFEISVKMNSQSMAIDLIKDKNGEIYVVEVSYGFPMLNFLDKSSGFWTSDLVYHEEKFVPQYWILENMIGIGKFDKVV